MQLNLFDKLQNKALEARSYLFFKEELLRSNCDRCELSRSRTHIVVDRGNPAAGIVLIGEAPGENEDREGRAFVGRAGKLLDQLMSEIGLDTEKHVLIVNIAKCRPPGNRAPRIEETHACLPYLKKQIALVKPRLIILLGATALKSLIRRKTDFLMENEVGKVFRNAEFPGSDLMVLYHPAFLLYDPRKIPVMKAHLKILKEYLNAHDLHPSL